MYVLEQLLPLVDSSLAHPCPYVRFLPELPPGSVPAPGDPGDKRDGGPWEAAPAVPPVRQPPQEEAPSPGG